MKQISEIEEELKKFKNVDEAIDYLNNNGVQISKDNSGDRELSDEEMDNVTGGLDIGYIVRLLLKKLFMSEEEDVKD